MQLTVYRGRVETNQNGQMAVAQLEGHDYGAPLVVFHLQQEAQSSMQIKEGAFVEVWYNGIFTRSMPPQATAQKVVSIAASAQNILINGTLQSVQNRGEFYHIKLMPHMAEQSLQALGLAASTKNTVMLVVPLNALEGIDPEELVEGAQLSAVTKGIATLSLPPQYPVHALLPIT